MTEKKSPLKRLADWIRRTRRRFNAHVRDAEEVISVLKTARRILNNPFIGAITDAIPGTLDDRIVKALDKAVNTLLNTAEGFQALTKIRHEPEQLQNAVLAKTASIATKELNPWLNERQADELTQVIYNNSKLP